MSVWIRLRRSDLEAARACSDGLALFDSIAAAQGHPKRVRVCWSVLAQAWMATMHGSFFRWLVEKGFASPFFAPGANLVRANLDGANLVRANLDGANLVGANLVRANLDGANLDGANLDGANLDGANLDGANLDGANLVRANLVRANLVRASLDGANLDGARNFSPAQALPTGLESVKVACGCCTEVRRNAVTGVPAKGAA